MRIIFMGTPDFAVPSLKTLYENGYEIAGVVTAIDKPAGRGLKVKTPPVKDFAVKHKLPVYQPKNLKDPDFAEQLRALKPDLQVVVAFRMLPEVVWQIPAKGTFNLHASLLPDYRGAAPINWAIINGEKKTGLTTFFIDKKIDTGNIIFRTPEPIYEDDNAGSLHDRLMHKGAGLVLDSVKAIESGHYETYEQDMTGNYKQAPKIRKEDCCINWRQSQEQVYNFIRGLSPFPAAYTFLNGRHCKITKAGKVPAEKAFSAGSEGFVTDEKTYLHVAVTDGAIAVEELQLEGKKKMHIGEFLRGTKVESID